MSHPNSDNEKQQQKERTDSKSIVLHSNPPYPPICPIHPPTPPSPRTHITQSHALTQTLTLPMSHLNSHIGETDSHNVQVQLAHSNPLILSIYLPLSLTPLPTNNQPPLPALPRPARQSPIPLLLQSLYIQPLTLHQRSFQFAHRGGRGDCALGPRWLRREYVA